MREPAFWWQPPGTVSGTVSGIASRLLMPLGAIYGGVSGRRMRRPGAKPPVPVICVGNFTVGGAGKTPTAIAIARLLQVRGAKPFFLTRGYGGRLTGPVRVEQSHGAGDVGDEPLLLAEVAPTIVAADRVAGAEFAAASGASVVVMDDGFQNPSLEKTLSLVVIDGSRGLGNGRVLPAGPLRAPLSVQLAKASAVVVIGPPAAGKAIDLAIDLAIDAVTDAALVGPPRLRAKLEPRSDDLAALRGQPVLAFAGIGHPEKFFATLKDAGVTVAAEHRFDDHHRYTSAEAEALSAEAARRGLVLVTTQKDRARMQGDRALTAFHQAARVLTVDLVFEDTAAVGALLDRAMRA